MKFRLMLLTAIILSVLISCSNQPPPTQVVLVVTATPNPTTGAVPLEEPSSTPPAGTEEATDDAQSLARTATTTPSPTNVPATIESIFPTPSIGQVYVAEQAFERGRMFWVRPVDQIWVISEDEEGNQIWQVYEDTFEDNMPESDPSLTPPDNDLLQPVRGFGMLWRENENIRRDIGWATEPEVGYFANYEYHAGGTVEDGRYVQRPGYHLLENLARNVYRFNEGVWTWEVVERSDE